MESAYLVWPGVGSRDSWRAKGSSTTFGGTDDVGGSAVARTLAIPLDWGFVFTAVVVAAGGAAAGGAADAAAAGANGLEALLKALMGVALDAMEDTALLGVSFCGSRAAAVPAEPPASDSTLPVRCFKSGMEEGDPGDTDDDEPAHSVVIDLTATCGAGGG